MSDALGTRVACYEESVRLGRARLVRYDIAGFIYIDQSVEASVVGDLTYGYEARLTGNGDVVSSATVSENARFEFFSDEFFEADVLDPLDVVLGQKDVRESLVAEKLIHPSADVDLVAISRQEYAVLESGIGVAYQNDVFAFIESTVAHRAITDAVTDEIFLSVHAYRLVVDAVGDNDGTRVLSMVVDMVSEALDKVRSTGSAPSKQENSDADAISKFLTSIGF